MSPRPLLRVDPWIERHRARGGVTTRVGFPLAATGEADEASRARTRALVARAIGRPVEDLAWVRQVHGIDVVHVDTGGGAGEGDALVTDRAGLVLATSIADCAPVAVWDRRGPWTGIAHAGWRGAVDGVVEATVDALVAGGADRTSLHAWIGPRIGPDHFEVGPEVADRFDPGDVIDRDPRPHVDLGRAIVRRLAAIGVDGDRVRLHPDCTFTRDELYWSYRRDGGVCGRQIAFVTR